MIQQILQIINELVNKTIPSLEERLNKKIDESRTPTQSTSGRVILFYGTGQPPVTNPSQLAWYKSRDTGIMWYWNQVTNTWKQI